MRAANALDTGLRKPEVFDLAFLDQLPDRTRDILHGHRRIDAVLVEQIDGINTQPLQGFFRDLANAHGAAIRPRDIAGRRVNPEAEFGRNDHLAAIGGKRLPDQLLIGEGTVDLRGIEEGDATFHGGPDQGNTVTFLNGRPEAEAQSHASQPQGRNIQTAFSKCSSLHEQLLLLVQSYQSALAGLGGRGGVGGGGAVPPSAAPPARATASVAAVGLRLSTIELGSRMVVPRSLVVS